MLEIIALIVIAVLGIASVEWDNWFGAVVTLIGTAAAVQWWFQVPVWATVVANPLLILSAIVVYVAIGLSYSTMIRFPRWIRSRTPQIASAWLDYVKMNPDDHSEEAFRESYRFRDFTAAYNGDLIASWAIMWPWGLAWDLVNRPIRFVYRNVYRAFEGVLANIERRAVARAVTKKGP